MAIQAYKVVTGIGDNLEEGEIVHLDSDTAQPLVDAGILAEATEEDMNGGEEVKTVDAPDAVSNAAKSLGKKVEETTEKAVHLIAEKMLKNSVPAPVIPTKGVHVAGSDERLTWGFKSVGDFALSAVGRGTDDTATRKMAAAQKSYLRSKDAYSTSGGPSITANDGGVLIPPAYAAELFEKKIDGVANLYDFTTDFPYQNTTVIPVNNKTNYNTGIRSYWLSEYTPGTQTTPVLDHVDLKADTLVTLVPVTDQLLTESAFGLEAFIRREAPEQMVYRKNASLLYGNGSGANVMAAASTVVVTRSTASRISFADLNQMYAQCSNPSKAAWFVSPSYFPELQRLSFPNASGSFPIFVPNVGGYPSISGPVPGTIHGRPVILTDMMQPTGTKGDIMFADLSSVAKIEKQLDSSVSVHFYFDRLASLFRFAIRTNTVSQWKTTWQRPDGTVVGPVVLLSGSSGTTLTPPTFS